MKLMLQWPENARLGVLNAVPIPAVKYVRLQCTSRKVVTASAVQDTTTTPIPAKVATTHATPAAPTPLAPAAIVPSTTATSQVPIVCPCPATAKPPPALQLLVESAASNTRPLTAKRAS